MESTEAKSMRAVSGGATRQVTYVQTKTYTVDEKGLRKALTAKVFDKYTVKSLNRPALEKAMGEGEVDPKVVARFVEEKLSKPYLRYSEKEDQ